MENRQKRGLKIPDTLRACIRGERSKGAEVTKKSSRQKQRQRQRVKKSKRRQSETHRERGYETRSKKDRGGERTRQFGEEWKKNTRAGGIEEEHRQTKEEKKTSLCEDFFFFLPFPKIENQSTQDVRMFGAFSVASCNFPFMKNKKKFKTKGHRATEPAVVITWQAIVVSIKI